MYKVFFNDKALFLTDDFSKNFQTKYGLFYKFREKEDLQEIIEVYGRLTKIKSLIVFHFDIEVLQEVFISCFTLIEAAGGVVRNKNGEFLLIFRRGKWDLPKGKLDKGENFREAAVREVCEETGLERVNVIKPMLSTYHTYPYKGETALKKTYWFEMVCENGVHLVPQTEEDIEEVKWFKEEELPEPFENTFPLVKDVFKYLGIHV